eukprot:s4537_g10.t1
MCLLKKKDMTKQLFLYLLLLQQEQNCQFKVKAFGLTQCCTLLSEEGMLLVTWSLLSARQVPCKEAKNDGTGETPALVHEGEGNGPAPSDQWPAADRPGEDPPAGGDGEDPPAGGDGGDGPHPADGENHKEDEEEEEEEERDDHVHPDLPKTPEGSYSSSEADWRRKGYSNDDILQKKHQKEVRRVTARSAEELLNKTQEEMPQHLSIAHMEKTIAEQELQKTIEKHEKELETAYNTMEAEAEKLQKKKEFERAASEKRIQDEIQKRKMMDEQELRKQELLAKIAEAKAKEKENAEDLAKMHRELELQQEFLEEQAAMDAEKEKEKNLSLSLWSPLWRSKRSLQILKIRWRKN